MQDLIDAVKNHDLLVENTKILYEFYLFVITFWMYIGKVQVFWKGPKNLKKSPTCFDATEQMSKQVGDFFFVFRALLTMS